MKTSFLYDIEMRLINDGDEELVIASMEIYTFVGYEDTTCTFNGDSVDNFSLVSSNCS